MGGCVRDLVLGREPKDYDISTDARPDQLLSMFPSAQLVGAQFGVVLVDGVEVATFRSDHSYQDGRHPTEVTFETDARQDVLRRDFTINALLLDPDHSIPPSRFRGGGLRRRPGRSARHMIRAIGDPEQRFEEDHLRMLRAIRFAARFGFEIEPGTLAAIQKLHRGSRAFRRNGFAMNWCGFSRKARRAAALNCWTLSGLLGDILPEVAAMKGVEQPPEFHPGGRRMDPHANNAGRVSSSPRPRWPWCTAARCWQARNFSHCRAHSL